MTNTECGGESGTGSVPSPVCTPNLNLTSSLFLFEKGEKINIRLLCDGGEAVNIFVDDLSQVEQRIAELDEEPSVKSICVQLQVLKPEANDELSFGRGVKRHHIGRYRWLVVDIDTLRPDKAKTNATEEEKQSSFVTADALRSYLRETGWPEPALCDSGNGWHLVWRVDMPNTQEDFELLHSCLVVLAAKFNNQTADIDTSLAEPEQIIKLWGTMTRKGENTPDRPWRRSCVVSLPKEFEVVTPELLHALAAQAPVRVATKKKRGSKYPIVHYDFEPEDFFEWCQENLPKEYQEFFCRDCDADRNDADGHHYVMDGCFWAERKHSGDRRKTEFILGRTFGWKCFSDDCDGVRIGDILRKMTKLAGKPYPGQIWKQDELVSKDMDFVDYDDELAGEARGTDLTKQKELGDTITDADALAALINVTTHKAVVENPGVVNEKLLPISERLAKVNAEEKATESDSGADPLAFPEQAMYGKLGEMATAIKMPLGLGYPAVIGVYSTMPDVDEMAGTRINNYVILLAPPGGGKNLAIKRALALVGLSKEHFKKSAPVSDRGLMQLVGHRVENKRNGEKNVTPGPRKLLLVTNEAANVLKKANIKNSSLGATLCELWDENEYAPADRSGEHGCNCRLSWIGGLPIKREHPEEFGEYFGRETGRGLLSRTILGFSDMKFNYREWNVPSVWSNDENGCMAEMAFQNQKEVHIAPEA
jgi:hypothetical protein